MSSTIYMDYAAATPLDSDVLAVMKPYYSEAFYNPSALYIGAKNVHNDISEARASVANRLGARPSEIIFVAGGTEANNLAIHGVMDMYPTAHLIVSAIEHESILRPARHYSGTQVLVGEDGRVALDDLVSKIDENTVFVSVMYANNEIGTIQPIRQISGQIAQIRQQRKKADNSLPLYLHVDACQVPLYLDLHVARLGVDMMTINGGKMYGPKQSGVLYIRTGVQIGSQTTGGGQEFGIRSGTENVPSIIGLSKAFDNACERRSKESERMVTLQTLFFDLISKQLPKAIVNGSRKYRLPNNIHITIPGMDNERLVMALDEVGIQVAVGSACSASSDKPSHVLNAIGLDDAAAQSSLRFTMGKTTDEQSIHRVVDELARLVV